MKLTIKICLILHAWPTGTQNQDLRALLDSFRLVMGFDDILIII